MSKTFCTRNKLWAYALFAFYKVKHHDEVLFQPSGRINRRYYIGLA